MSTKFFTNKNEQKSLYNKFKGVIENNEITYFDALVGYFRASGYFQMRHLLQNIPQIRILVGIDVDKLSATFHKRGQLYLENRELTKETFLKEVKKDIETANYKKDIEEGILQFVEDIISGRIEMRASGGQRLHAKIYIFRPKNFNEHSFGNAITGSSNFTSAGLGTSPMPNYEFNVLIRDYDNVTFALEEFEELWEKAVPVLPVDAQNIKKQSYLNDEITPYELYIKMLIEYFGKSIDRKDVFDSRLPKGYTNLEYQADAVIDGFKKLLNHNGFILADVVGLGKTVIAIRIIKKYIQFNGVNTKILVVHPPAVTGSWKSTAQDFGLTNYIQFITNGSLHKIIDGENYDFLTPEEYDLVIVDESHKFRNSNSDQYSLLELICKTPRKHTGNDSNRRKKVMLLSATPLNNKPEDIANQIYLFQDARKSTISGTPNLQSFFYPKAKAYKKLKKIEDHDELVKAVKQIYLPIRDLIFKEIVIRRTRADIRRIKRYQKDIEERGMTFPKENAPIAIHYTFDERLNNLFIETMNLVGDKGNSNGLGYYRYRAIEFIDEQYEYLYDNAKQISEHLSGIMRTQLVKRLESSFYAFKKSLTRLQISNQRMVEMFENDKIFIAPDLDVNKYYDEGKMLELEAKIKEINTESPNNAIYKKDDFDEKLLFNLQHDQEVINGLVKQWSKINYDPKLDKFLEELEGRFMNEGNREKKLVVFSESKDTVDYLKKKLNQQGRKDVLGVSSKNQKSRYRTIINNFDANLDEEKKAHNYNIIITTEVLAEGINLHRSNVILNYDIPWNATRLMQRIGRINRLGTKAKEIFVYNFYPTTQSNTQINLNEKALKKLQGFHAAFSEDNKVYHEMEELIETTLGDLNQGTEEVNDLLIQLEFIRNFKEQNPKEFNRIKKMPLKSRTGRNANVNKAVAKRLLGQPLQNTCLSYVRNDRRDAFYIVNAELAKEITFSTAVKLFEAKATEKRTDLLSNHFEWIDNALKDFFDTVNTSAFNDDIDTANLAVQERNAILFLKSTLKMGHHKKYKRLFSPAFMTALKTATMVIFKGIFRKFRIEIANLAAQQKKYKKPLPEVIQKLKNIFAKYPLTQIARLEELRLEEAKNAPIIEKPTIVLSETFK